MSNSYAGAVYIVSATKDGKTDYWVATTTREDAVATVESQLGPGWTLARTNNRLPTETMAELKMRPDCIRKLDRAP
jgi:hypothetical protein